MKLSASMLQSAKAGVMKIGGGWAALAAHVTSHRALVRDKLPKLRESRRWPLPAAYVDCGALRHPHPSGPG